MATDVGTTLERIAVALESLIEALVAKKAAPRPPRNESGKPEYCKAFEAFWDAFPKHRRTAKVKAYEAWVRAGKRLRARGMGSDAAVAYLWSAAKQFAESPKGRGEFCPMPSTWLNGGCYDDSPDAWKHNGSDQQGDDLREWNFGLPKYAS
jgi:hypothetical protein